MGKKLKIFFIDDDIALGHICTRIMQEEGYEVLYQTSLNGAKACIVETHPDMIVLDVEIGNKNGIEAVPELKAIAPNTPILFISSHTNSQLVVQALSAGAVAYLKKPLEIDELIDKYLYIHFESANIDCARFQFIYSTVRMGKITSVIIVTDQENDRNMNHACIRFYFRTDFLAAYAVYRFVNNDNIR